MSNTQAFVDHVLDLLAPSVPSTARAMFGGHGIYAEGVMFGLLDDDELFLKTDEATRATFVEGGCRQWVYVNKKVRMENTGYFRPPDGAHEDPEAMLPWARLALDAALRARAAKEARGKRKPKGAARARKAPKSPARRRAPTAKARGPAKKR